MHADRSRVAAMVGLSVLGGAMVACGADSGGGDVVAACDAIVAIDQAVTVREDIEGGIEALKAFAAAAPEDVAARVEPAIAALDQDPEAAMESEEVVTAEDAFDAYALDHCADTRVDVTATDYAFAGIPAEIDAGRVVFDLVNESESGEAHEAIVLRRKDGVEESAHDILARATPTGIASLSEMFEKFTIVDVGWTPPDDTEDVFVADLEPGAYVVTCMLPEDSADNLEAYFAGQDVQTPRHFDKGMFTAFTVT